MLPVGGGGGQRPRSRRDYQTTLGEIVDEMGHESASPSAALGRLSVAFATLEQWEVSRRTRRLRAWVRRRSNGWADGSRQVTAARTRYVTCASFRAARRRPRRGRTGRIPTWSTRSLAAVS